MERVKEVRTCFMNYHLIWIELKNGADRLSNVSVLKCLIVSLMINQAFLKEMEESHVQKKQAD